MSDELTFSNLRGYMPEITDGLPIREYVDQIWSGPEHHACPLTLGEVLALAAIAQCRGNTALAAKLIEHQTQHEAPAVKEAEANRNA